MVDEALFTSNSDEWSTPQDLYDLLNKEFNFNLDPCATKENAKCEKYFTIEDDGLKQSWGFYTVFANPPYSDIKKWIEKAYNEAKEFGTKVVLLIPARTDTKYWHEYVQYGEIRFLKGRLKFGDSKNSAPFPSAVVIFDFFSNQKAVFWDWKKEVVKKEPNYSKLWRETNKEG